MTEEQASQLSMTELRWLGQHALLEPEEARMLARFLIEAADEHERLGATG